MTLAPLQPPRAILERFRALLDRHLVTDQPVSDADMANAASMEEWVARVDAMKPVNVAAALHSSMDNKFYIGLILQETLLSIYDGASVMYCLQELEPQLRGSLHNGASTEERESILSDGGIPAPLATTKLEQIQAYWHRRGSEVDYWTSQLVLAARQKPIEVVVELFFSFPVATQVCPEQYGLSCVDSYVAGLASLASIAQNSASHRTTVEDALRTPLDVVKLCPLPLAVLIKFIEFSDVSRELGFGFLYAFGGWLLHKDFHVVLNIHRPDHKVRPRVFVHATCSSNCGKSPFFDRFVGSAIAGNDETTSLVAVYSDLFVDGGAKGFNYAEATNADFATRMGETGGRLFWTSLESLSCIDRPRQRGVQEGSAKGRRPRDVGNAKRWQVRTR